MTHESALRRPGRRDGPVDRIDPFIGTRDVSNTLAVPPRIRAGQGPPVKLFATAPATRRAVRTVRPPDDPRRHVHAVTVGWTVSRGEEE